MAKRSARYNGVYRGTGARPFKIWNANEKKNVAHRCYSTEDGAKDKALVLIKYEKVGVAFEVYDDRNKNWVGTYARKVKSIYIEEKVS